MSLDRGNGFLVAHLLALEGARAVGIAEPFHVGMIALACAGDAVLSDLQTRLGALANQSCSSSQQMPSARVESGPSPAGTCGRSQNTRSTPLATSDRAIDVPS